MGGSSKPGAENIHGKIKTDLVKAMSMHVFRDRYRGMTEEDKEYAARVLAQSEIVEAMGYTSRR